MEPDGVIESNWTEIVDSFDEMELKEELLRGVYGYGFERPSAIQQRAILPCIRERDVIAQAQSGKCDSLSAPGPRRRHFRGAGIPCAETPMSISHASAIFAYSTLPHFLFVVFVKSSILDDKTNRLSSDWAR